MTETNVFHLSQPGTFTDPLTEVLRNGARALLAQAVELIATATQVNLVAARRSFPVAAYLAYALNQLEVRTQLLDNVGGMNREFATRIGADEAVVAISFRNYTGEVVEIADACRRRGPAVIAITDSKWTREALVRDPQGGVFTASQFIPPDR